MYATRLFISVIALTAVFAGALISGPSHTSLSLDGATSVSIPSDASTMAGKSFSFEAWIMAPDVSRQMPIVSRINSSSSNPTDEQNDFALQINAQGHVVLTTGGAGEIGFLLFSNNPITANTWYHVAFTIEYLNAGNDAPYRANLYVDSYPTSGKIRDQQTSYWYGPGASRIVLTNEVITVGKYINDKNPSGIFFSGSIDEIRVWQGVRTGADIKAYSFVSVENSMDSTWALTVAQKGTSANLLICSYNMNQVAKKSRATSTLDDQSRNGFAATVQGTAAFGADGNQFIQYVRVSGQVPAVVPLYGLNTKSTSENVQFVVYWMDSELQGELFVYDSMNSGKGVSPKKTTPYFPVERRENVGIGAMITNNSLVDITERSVIVFVALNTSTANARLRYYSVYEGMKSSVTEVRLTVGCIGNFSAIDACGVCNGDNNTCRYCDYIDRCGICNGTNDCVGCDNVTNSGMQYDKCGVCGGLNLCLGCDHMGGGVKDACGVCNGDNSTCGGCVLDYCGICNGDNSSCTCVRYHGYHVEELDYLLLRWGVQNSLINIDAVLAQLDKSLSLLQNYNGEVDLAAMVSYMNSFSAEYLDDYDNQITKFVNLLNVALGNTDE